MGFSTNIVSGFPQCWLGSQHKQTLLKRLKMPARFFTLPNPPDTVPRNESMRVADRDLPRTFDAAGEFGDPSDDAPMNPE